MDVEVNEIPQLIKDWLRPGVRWKFRMVGIYMKRVGLGLMPTDSEGNTYLKKYKETDVFLVNITRPRNIGFHKKYFALLSHAYEAWQPGIKQYKDQIAEKNFDRFREDITIMAGYYEPTYAINGDLKLKAKSISFGSMEQEEFEALYSKVVDVILKHILKNYSKDDLDNVVNEILSFV